MKKKISEKNIRGLVLTLKPNNAQKLLLDKHLNDTRFIYNQYVEEYLKAIKENRLPNYKDYQDILQRRESWKIYKFVTMELFSQKIRRKC